MSDISIADGKGLTVSRTMTLTSAGDNGVLSFPNSTATIPSYEEGSWTPTIEGSGSSSGVSYGVQYGGYIRISRLVIAEFRVILSSKGTLTGVVLIGGLPFAIDSSSPAITMIPFFQDMATAWTCIGGRSSSSTKLLLQGMQSAGTGSGALSPSDLSNTTAFYGSVSYQTS